MTVSDPSPQILSVNSNQDHILTITSQQNGTLLSHSLSLDVSKYQLKGHFPSTEASSKGSSLSPLGMAAPSMKERQACWGARDEYWKCLDENTEDASQCKKLRSSFESSCPQQWIKYFDKRRDYLKFKEKFEAGQFQPSKTPAKS
ncbi:cytochrome c oxidase assembly factor 6 homolog isoform X2 [Callorhinus ursinus]